MAAILGASWNHGIVHAAEDQLGAAVHVGGIGIALVAPGCRQHDPCACRTRPPPLDAAAEKRRLRCV